MSDLSRVEQLLRNALGEDIYEVTPQSRVEILLAQLNELIEGISASVDPEELTPIVTAWLAENIHDGAVVDTSLSVSGAAAESKKVGDELSDLKEDLTTIYPSVADSEVSTNVVTFNDYSGQTTGINYSVVDDMITINGTASETTNIYLYYKNYPLTLTAGNYAMTVDDGLVQPNMDVQVIGFNQVLQNSQNQKAFTLASDTSNPSLRIRFTSGTTVSWTGHFWINPNTAQKYIPKGKTLYTPKTLVEEYQGEENSGKVLAVGTDGNVTLINNAVDNVASKTLYKRGNLLDYSEVTKGYIKADGTVQTYNSLWCSGYIPMYGDTVYCNADGNGNVVTYLYFAFYDDNKDLVASYDTIGSMQKATATIYYVAVPSGAKYFRCTFTSDQSVTQTAWISNDFEKPYPEDVYNIDNVYPFTLNPSNPCDYSELTVRAFSKVVCIGDSLTWGGFNMDDNSSSTGQTVSKDELAQRYSYPSCFQRITGVDTANKGTSGVTAAQWYTQFQSDDFSEFDLAIIFLGVNDSAQHVSDADTLTAMQNIVTMLNTARSDMRIAICSCIPAYNSTGYQAKGQLILNWAKGINDPNIIPLDLAQYSHVRPQTSYVAGHMSALGYYMMALDIARYLSWYMDHHKRDFRFIQFIGSPDASWTGD